MIDAAVECGVDGVKFQAFGLDLFSAACYNDDPRQKKLMEEFPYLKRLFTQVHPNLKEEMAAWSLTKDMAREIKEYCDEKGTIFFCTPLTVEWADFLVDELDMPFIKVASMDLNNYPFLRHLARKKRPIVLSTGLSTMSEIMGAVETIQQEGGTELVVLHCLSVYPAPAEVTNLRNIDMLREYFDLPVGFSYNSSGFAMPIAAVARGACVIEQHFTIDKTLPGWDHAISADPSEMKIVVREAHNVQKALGSYARQLSAAEVDKRYHFRRSLVVLKDMSKGAVLLEKDIDFRRPGGIGIQPSELQFALGRKLKHDVCCEDIISFRDLE
jgi:N-acetylneuraminate synthase